MDTREGTPGNNFPMDVSDASTAAHLWVNQLNVYCGKPVLVGGLEHLLFSHILGIIIPID